MSQPIQLNLDDPFNADRFGELDDRLIQLPGTVNPGADTILRPIINTPGGVVRPGIGGNPAAFTDPCSGCTNGCSGTCGCADELGF